MVDKYALERAEEIEYIKREIARMDKQITRGKYRANTLRVMRARKYIYTLVVSRLPASLAIYQIEAQQILCEDREHTATPIGLPYT